MVAARFTDRRIAGGLVGLAAIGVLVLGAFAGLAFEALRGGRSGAAIFDPYLMRVIRFTLWQAVLSTLLSVLPAMLVARALYRQTRFPGRALIIRLFAVPLALPAIVAALAILALLGRAGLLAGPLGTITGGNWGGIYGLAGILVAHVFFNLPLATRLFLEALETIPADSTRLAAQLGMGARASLRHLEWPALRAAMPGIAALVFMLCVTSFTIVLTLGGGPRATTLEVAIYQSLRFDFDPSRAMVLTLVQVALTVLVVIAVVRLGGRLAGETGLSLSARRFIGPSRGETWANILVLAAAALFVCAPMAAIVQSGLQADLVRLAGERSVREAAWLSLWLAACAAGLGVALSFALVAGRRALEIGRGAAAPSLLERFLDNGTALVLVLPPIVLGAGWFILLLRHGSVFSAAPYMVVAVNAVMAMPFVARVIRPAYDAASARHERLSASLGIKGIARLRLVDWPAMRRPLATGFAFAMALSLGDLGVIALFGSEGVQTLPYLLLSRMGAYRTQDAAGLALMLGLMCLALIYAADRLGGRSR